jgi:hypothetical protein
LESSRLSRKALVRFMNSLPSRFLLFFGTY